MGGGCLTGAADVVELALDRQQRRCPDRAEVDVPAPVGEFALRQQGLLEYVAQGLEIEFGRQVGDGEIFIVELLDRFRLAGVPLGETVVQLAMGLPVALHVHGHEGGKLNESWIDAPPRPAVAPRYGGNQIALEPIERSAG